MVRRNRENTGKDNMLRGKEDVHRKVEYEKLEKGISLVPNPLAPGSTCQMGNPKGMDGRQAEDASI